MSKDNPIGADQRQDLFDFSSGRAVEAQPCPREKAKEVGIIVAFDG
jgi:hypothetical protein